jgi:predicted phosphatase
VRYFFLLFIFVFSLQAKILEIKNINEIKEYLTKDSIVIFDLDNTIMEPIQIYGSDQWFAYQLKEYLKDNLTFDDALFKTIEEWHKIQAVSKVKLVEPNVKDIILNLQKNNQIVMGFTLRDQDFAFSAIEQLSSLGIDFKKTSIIKNNIRDDILFREGILFSSGMSKGIVLDQFFKRLNYKPKKMVYIDDKLKHVKSIEDYANKNNIEFTGFRYGYLDDKVNSFSAEISDIQKKYFEKSTSFGDLLLNIK